MEKPQFYEHIKSMRENKNLLKQVSKDNQIFKNQFISEDLLIRSHKEIQRNVLPFMKQMNHPAIAEIKELASFTNYRDYSNGYR